MSKIGPDKIYYRKKYWLENNISVTLKKLIDAKYNEM